MKKELLIFGANGALGSGITSALSKKEYDPVHLFDLKFEEKPETSKIKQIVINDLSNESNVEAAFSNISPGKDKQFFLYSTIGGFFGGKKVWETGDDDWNKMMNMNLKTSFLIAKHFAKLVEKSHSGSACFTAAFTGLLPEKDKSAYGVSKAALVHLVKTLAEESGEIKLSVNALAPYIIDTHANREWMNNDNSDKWQKPEEIGELVHSIFKNYHFISGNIFTLKHRFEV